ncbi:MAG TPA: Hsp20 family protein [Bacillales bacterium]|nr:Hsp20 family protein [Bacillales bacterium]
MKENQSNNTWFRQAQHFLGSDFWADFKDIVVGAGPMINLYKADNEVVCLVNLPGMQLKDTKVYVHHRTLKVSGKLNFHFQGYELVEEEIFQGEFERIIELPFPVMDTPVRAYFSRGFLVIRMMKLFSSGQTHHEVEIEDFES